MFKTKVLSLSQCVQRLDAQDVIIEKLNTRLQQLQELFVKSNERKPQLISGRNRTSTIVLPSTFPKAVSETAKNSLIGQLADHVDSVVGLKEAITWKRRGLKYIWAATLFAGVIATGWFVYASAAEYLAEPTATKVKVMANLTYEYPPISICPPAWLDVTKATSLGLSLEGLKYSLGFINKNDDKANPENSTIASEEFFDFFETRNFTSFNNYLMAVSADIPVHQTSVSYYKSNGTSAYCSSCFNNASLSKMVIDGIMCYKFQLIPEDSRQSLLSPRIFVKMLDKTMDVTQGLLWQVHVNPNPALRRSSGSKIMVKPFTLTQLRIAAEKFVSLDTPISPCLTETETKKNYSSDSCIAECLCPLYSQIINCTLFDVTVESFDVHPRQLCNYVSMPFFFMTDTLKLLTDKLSHSKEANECYKKCPNRCERITYEAVRQNDAAFSDTSLNLRSSANRQQLLNFTALSLQLENAALSQGGIMTWKEISTISFTTLVSNVGGALGLFVGGTLMTFVQLILFVVKYTLERRKNKGII